MMKRAAACASLFVLCCLVRVGISAAAAAAAPGLLADIPVRSQEMKLKARECVSKKRNDGSPAARVFFLRECPLVYTIHGSAIIIVIITICSHPFCVCSKYITKQITGKRAARP